MGATAVGPLAVAPDVASGLLRDSLGPAPSLPTRLARRPLSGQDRRRETTRQKAAMAELPGVSSLRMISVGPQTVKRYNTVVAEFKKRLAGTQFYQLWEILESSTSLVETALLEEYMDHLFLGLDRSVNAGALSIAAAVWAIPRFHQMGRRNLLPRVSQALEGWS